MRPHVLLPMRLLLVRHAETTWNERQWIQGHADPPLSERGEAQARRLAEALAPEVDAFDAIFTSPLQRATRVAEIVRGKTAVPVRVDARLKSRDLGEISGLTLAQVKERYPALYKRWVSGDPGFRPPGGQSTAEIVAQLRSFLRDLWTEFGPAGHVLLVSHRENIGGLRMLLTGTPIDRETLRLPNCVPVVVDWPDGRLPPAPPAAPS